MVYVWWGMLDVCEDKNNLNKGIDAFQLLNNWKSWVHQMSQLNYSHGWQEYSLIVV